MVSLYFFRANKSDLAINCHGVTLNRLIITDNFTKRLPPAPTPVGNCGFPAVLNSFLPPFVQNPLRLKSHLCTAKSLTNHEKDFVWIRVILVQEIG